MADHRSRGTMLSPCDVYHHSFARLSPCHQCLDAACHNKQMFLMLCRYGYFCWLLMLVLDENSKILCLAKSVRSSVTEMIQLAELNGSQLNALNGKIKWRQHKWISFHAYM